ncbi:hypothetical protein GA0116948_101504 [Chitinophaga costaii]|uniref:Uncharacterized protein n=1 Tax=Chitinophaga costaii TaxID=1335309 RepID=A0A1C3ZQB3_9BACT|nr:hypothetical protein GA0116948_101504 [Chitinophaga costaii]
MVYKVQGTVNERCMPPQYYFKRLEFIIRKPFVNSILQRTLYIIPFFHADFQFHCRADRF